MLRTDNVCSVCIHSRETGDDVTTEMKRKSRLQSGANKKIKVLVIVRNYRMLIRCCTSDRCGDIDKCIVRIWLYIRSVSKEPK